MKKQTENPQAPGKSDGSSSEVSGKAEIPAVPDETGLVVPQPSFPFVEVGQVYAIATTERERGLETDETSSLEGAGR